MFQILTQGLFTTVQDTRGRQGVQYLGFPPSGAMDPLALTAGNVLVGNDPDEAGIEFALSAPQLRFEEDTVFAVTGLPMHVSLDGEEQPMWQAIAAKKGQTLRMTAASGLGQWGYISFAGGIDVQPYLGSKATFTFCGVGGFEGRQLRPGDRIPTGRAEHDAKAGMRVKGQHIPILTNPMVVELMEGYYGDFLTKEDVEHIFSSDWKVLNNSNRTGYRIAGPHIAFSDKARNKSKEAGSDPSNIFDTGYPAYSVNMCGDTSIILTTEAVCAGGYFCPYCVPLGAQWKIGQVRIGSNLRFRLIDADEAARLRDIMECFAHPESDFYTI